MRNAERRSKANVDASASKGAGTGREVWLFAALALGVCLGARLVYFIQYARGLPFLWGPVGDSWVYLEQAAHVARGEHGDATLLAFSPLYGYALALLGAPPDLVVAAVLQLLSGVVVAAILFLTAYRLGDRKGDALGALITTLLFGLYGGALFLESKILSDSLGLLLIVGVQAVLLLPQFRAGNAVTCAFCGVLLAFAVLARASLVFCVPLFVLAALFPFGSRARALRVRVKRSASLALGVALILVGHGLWTQKHAGVFVPVILQSQTLQASQSTTWTGDIHALSGGNHLAHPYSAVLGAREYLARRAADPQDTGGRGGVDLVAWWKGLPTKLPGTFSNGEKTFQYGYLGERSAVPLLRFVPVSFGVILLCGLVGAWVRWRRKGPWSLIPMVPLFLGAVACTTLYHPSTRYRLAMIVPLLLLAGPGLSWLWRTRRERGHRLLLLTVVASSVIAGGHALSKKLSNRALWELELATSTYVAGNEEAAFTHLSAAEAAAPEDPVVKARVKAGRELLNARDSGRLR